MANTAPNLRTRAQWDIHLHPDTWQPSKKGSESRQREELLKDNLEMLGLESPERASALSGHSHCTGTRGETNSGSRAKAEN